LCYEGLFTTKSYLYMDCHSGIWHVKAIPLTLLLVGKIGQWWYKIYAFEPFTFWMRGTVSHYTTELGCDK